MAAQGGVGSCGGREEHWRPKARQRWLLDTALRKRLPTSANSTTSTSLSRAAGHTIATRSLVTPVALRYPTETARAAAKAGA